MAHYPHMLSEDTEVWTKFLSSKSVRISEVWYDVRVGSMVKGAWPDDSLDARIAAGLTRKRIDVVAAVGGDVWVIEVKPRANMYAVGQVISYARLFAKEYITAGQVIPVIICDIDDEDLLDEYDEFGILVLANE